jgi:hypothetical protein
VILLIGQADVRDLRHLVIENGCADESGDESGPHLATERDPRGDVHVMGELEILGKVESLGGGDVTVGLEIIHGSGITGEPKTPEKLGDDVQGDLDVRNRHYYTTRDTEN